MSILWGQKKVSLPQEKTRNKKIVNEVMVNEEKKM